MSPGMYGDEILLRDKGFSERGGPGLPHFNGARCSVHALIGTRGSRAARRFSGARWLTTGDL